MPELPKIVTQQLQSAAEDYVHPDPNVITAFVENSLKPWERNQFFDHLARCSHCREVVSFSLPEKSQAILAPARPVSWLAWPVLRWGALAACVVIVGAAVMLRHESRSKSEAREVAIVDQKAAQAPSSPEPNRMEAANQVAIQPSGGNRDALSAPVAHMQVKKAGTAGKEQSQEAADNVGAGVAQNSLPDISAAESAPSSQTASMDEVVPGRAKDVPLESRAAQAPVAPGGGMIAKSKISMSAVAMSKAAYPSAILSPRWTLTSDGMLQRSLDSGATWETISVPDQPSLRALAANGLDIWVGGGSGALYHSSDAGQNWMQVRPVANGELLRADIIGVEFIDLQHGTLTTSAKETWITADAGQTWQKK